MRFSRALGFRFDWLNAAIARASHLDRSIRGCGLIKQVILTMLLLCLYAASAGSLPFAIGQAALAQVPAGERVREVIDAIDEEEKAQREEAKETLEPSSGVDSDSSPSLTPTPADADSSVVPSLPGLPIPEATKRNIEASLLPEKTGVPIVIAGEELFRIRARLGPYTPALRAHSIDKRLQKLEQRDNVKELVDEITTQENDYSTDIVAGDLTLMTVTTLDAKFEGAADRETLAKTYAAAIKRALSRDLEAKNPRVIFRAIGLSILATVIFVLIVAATNWVFPRIYRKLAAWRGSLIHSVKIQKAELLSEATITDLLIGSFRIIRIIVFLLILAIYFYSVLSFFPQTRPLVRDGLHQVAKPITEFLVPSVFGYFPNLIFIALIMASAYYLNVFNHYIFREVERGTIVFPGFDEDWADPTYKIVRFLIFAFALILLFPYLPGAGSPAFQQVSIFLGLLFSLASTGPLSHVIAGIFLTYTGALRVGDRVKIADTVGDVVEKTLIATKIQTIKNEVITIPNGLVLGNHIINYSSSSTGNGLILNTTVTLGYDVPWQDIEKALIRAALDTEFISSEPSPFVWQTNLGDFNVSYQLNAFTNEPNKMGAIYSELHKHIQDRCHEAGIEILSPTYSAVRDGNRAAMPQSFLPSDYQAPTFAISNRDFSRLDSTTKHK